MRFIDWIDIVKIAEQNCLTVKDILEKDTQGGLGLISPTRDFKGYNSDTLYNKNGLYNDSFVTIEYDENLNGFVNLWEDTGILNSDEVSFSVYLDEKWRSLSNKKLENLPSDTKVGLHNSYLVPWKYIDELFRDLN